MHSRPQVCLRLSSPICLYDKVLANHGGTQEARFRVQYAVFLSMAQRRGIVTVIIPMFSFSPKSPSRSGISNQVRFR